MAGDLIAAMAAGSGGNVQHSFQNVGKSLGGLFGSGNAESYNKGADAGLSLLKKQLEAAKLRDEAMARDSAVAKMTKAFPDMTPEMIDFAVNNMKGGMGSQFSSTMTGIGTHDKNQMRMDAAHESDPMAQNQILAALHGAPRDLTKITAGNAYDPTRPPEDQAIALTPDAAADNMRDDLVDQSQIYANRARGDASARVRTSSSGRPHADPVAQYAAKKKIGEIWDRYDKEMEGLSPEAQAKLSKQRDDEVKNVTAGSIEVVPATDSQNVQQAVGLWADDMKAAGFMPTAGQLEEAKRKLRRGDALRVEPFDDTNDGTTPPQVIEPNTGKPVTGGRGDKPGNKARDDVRGALTGAEVASGMPQRFGNVNHGRGASTVAAQSSSIPEAAAAKLKEGVQTRFGNGQVWSKRNGIPVRIQ